MRVQVPLLNQGQIKALSTHETLAERNKNLKLELEEREKWLKTIPSSGIDIMTDDGEIIKVYPPIKTSTTSFSVTLNK